MLMTDECTVLIVDDQPFNLKEVCSLLESRGHRVAIAQDCVKRLHCERLKRQNAKLAEQERQFRTLTEQLPDCIARYDHHGRWTFANRRLEETLGQSLDDLQGKTLLASCPGKVNTDYLASLESTLATGQNTEVDIVLPDTGHGPRTHNIRFVAERGTDGKAIGVLALGRDVTERRQAMRQLELLNHAVDTSNDAIFVHDDSLRFVFVNDTACRSLGYSQTELLTLRPPDIDPDVTFEDARAIMDSMIREQGFCKFKFRTRHRTKEGRIYPVEINASLFEYEGRVFGLSIVRDISESQRVEDALRFVAQRAWQERDGNFFAALTRHLGQALDVDCVVVAKLDELPVHADGVAMYARGEISSHFQYGLAGTPCDNVAKGRFCFYPQGVQQSFPADDRLAAMDAASYAGIPLLDSAGQPLGLIAVLSGKPLADEASVAQLLQIVAPRAAAELERIRSDAKLRARELEFRSLAENLPDNIARWDVEGRYVYINPTLERTLGVSLSAVIGKRTDEAFPDGRFAQAKADIAQVVATGRAMSFVRRFASDGNGEVRVHDISVVPEFAADGQICSVLGIGHDVTEKWRAERELLILGSAIDNASEGVFLVDGQQRFIYVNDAACRSLAYSRDELLRMGPVAIDPDLTPDRLAGMLANLFAHGPQLGRIESRHRTADGRIFPVEIFASVVEHDGEKMALIIARDIAERKRAEMERQAHMRFLEALNRVNRVIQEVSDLDRMMNSVLDEVLTIFDCDRVFLMHPCNPVAADWFVPLERTKSAYPGALAMGKPMPMTEEIAAKLRVLLKEPGPVRFGPGADHPLPAAVAQRFGFKSMMSMAIFPHVGESWEFGMQQCSHARVWSDEEARIFHEIGRRLADGLGSLLAYRELQEREAQLRDLAIRREAAREEERRRIARELHDDLGQQLTALRFNITMFDYLYGENLPALRQTTANLLMQVDNIVQSTRQVSSAMRPAVLDMGIVPALEWLVGEYAYYGDVSFELRALQDDVHMDENMTVVVFRIAQEALTNAIRHSKADHIQVVFAQEAGFNSVEVSDNGVGFNTCGPRERHSTGLVGMRERLLAVGGELLVSSSPGEGTVIRGRIPARKDGKETEQ